jgi:hypothetical protein
MGRREQEHSPSTPCFHFVVRFFREVRIEIEENSNESWRLEVGFRGLATCSMILLEEAQGEGHGAWYRLLSGERRKIWRVSGRRGAEVREVFIYHEACSRRRT